MMKSFAIALTAFLFAIAPAIYAADSDDEFEARVKKINTTADNKGMDVALQRIATETGVPIENVRNQHKRHPQTGAGGLMVANVLANETKKTPSVFLTEHANGKKWVAIARENKVSLDKVTDRLDRLESAIKTGGEKK